MLRMPFLSALASTLLVASMAVAQTSAPSIRSVTLSPATGVLTIAGEHLGASLQVIVDGQLVTSLPGATDTHVEVLAPATVLTTPGTYRLVAFDPVRKAWDGFIVSSAPATTVLSGAPTPAGAAALSPSGPAIAAPVTAEASSAGSTAFGPQPFTIIEDTGTPFRTAVGHRALDSNTTGVSNTAVGFDALTANTTGAANTAVGSDALQSNTTAFQNTAIGAQALRDNSTGGGNTANGFQAMTNNLVGEDNVAVGAGALGLNESGNENTVVGRWAMLNGIAANGNTGLGYNSLSTATGGFNTAVGHSAGASVGSGTHDIYIGSGVFGTSESNTIRIGLPFNSTTGQGQNRTFIAGIRGSSPTSGEAVYISSSGQLGSGPVVPAANSVGSNQVVADSLTAADLAPAAVGTSEIADGAVTPAKVSFAFAGLGANTFAGGQIVNGGNVDLDPSTATVGNLTKNGEPFLSNPGNDNTFLGISAGTVTPAGDSNTATGTSAMKSLTAGSFNVASGAEALFGTTAGDGNTAAGYAALFNTSDGTFNTAVGYAAGQNNSSGNYNVYLGASAIGSASDTNTMRLGLPYNATTQAGQNKTFIAGVAGTVLNGPAVQVFIDGNGQLGTLVPALFTGTINQPINANPRPDAAVAKALADQQALIEAQAAVIADLRARVAALEAASPARRRR